MKNVSSTERIIRLLIGILFIILALSLGPVWLRIIFLIIAVIAIITGITQKCPLYKTIGVSTCKSAKPEE